MCSVDDPVCASDADRLDCAGPVVRPTAEELLRPPARDLLCPEPGCGRRLPQPSALRFHLLQRHGRQPASPAPPPSAVFVCPEPLCGESGVSRKTRFSSHKALKQHYLKVHAPRTLHCPKCQTAAFASEALMRAHWRLCGADYRCGCGAQYSNLRTLRAHAAKHGHSTVLKLRTKLLGSDGLRRLAPKPSSDALNLLASIALAAIPARAARPVTCDAATQTAARRAPRGGRSSGTQTRLTSGTAGQPPPPPTPPCPPASRTAGSQCVAVAAASAASQAGPPLVWGLLWPAPAAAAAADLASCQTQTEERPRGATPRPRPRHAETARQTELKREAVPLEELLWEVQEAAGRSPPPEEETAGRLPLSQHTQTPGPVTASGRQSGLRTYDALHTPHASPPAAGSQTETDMLSAETQTQDPFDVIKHLLRAEDERLLFPELSEFSGTDIQTQTPWLTGDSQTQTPWWSDDRPAAPESHAQPPPVTHTETQTCLLCLGPCDCWGTEGGVL